MTNTTVHRDQPRPTLGDQPTLPTALGTAPWLAAAAAVLPVSSAQVQQRSAAHSFRDLGGSSLDAVRLAALLQTGDGTPVAAAALLADEPLASTLLGTVPRPPRASELQAPERWQQVTRGQEAMLAADQEPGETAFHLLFSADITGPHSLGQIRRGLTVLTRNHPVLRTVFEVSATGQLRQRTVDDWPPTILDQHLPAGVSDPIATVHALLSGASRQLLRPFDAPPIVWVLTPVDDHRTITTLLVHHAVVDGWSIGLLWQQLTTWLGLGQAPPPGDTLTGVVAADRATITAERAKTRADDLRDVPSPLILPSDLTRPAHQNRSAARLVFGLTPAAANAVLQLATSTGTTRNTVLCAAWSLVVGRRTQMSDLLMGVASAGRRPAEAIGPFVKEVPVHVRLNSSDPVSTYLQATGTAIRDALTFDDVPVENLTRELRMTSDPARRPLLQVGFAAHDELIPATLTAGPLTVRLHEGHCGGSVYDAILFIQQWESQPRLAIEYAVSVLHADEAADLAAALDHTLLELAASAPEALLEQISTITDDQRRRLDQWGRNTLPTPNTGLWQLIETAAAAHPTCIAVRDRHTVLTYAQLVHAATQQSAALAAAGVRAGDCVGIAVPPSTAEIIAVLAILRLGAIYTGIHPDTPRSLVAGMLDAAHVRVIVTDESLDTGWGARTATPTHTVQAALPADHPEVTASPIPPAAAADPARTAYIAFTSGSTGLPKPTLIPHRGVVRLVADPTYLRPDARRHFMRYAPLGFDASTLEIFAPLVCGGTVDVYDDTPLTADGLADFIARRQVRGIWLTAGLFRVIADLDPRAFAGLTQLLTGGDVVPPDQVATVLGANPGLRITNGYGPTENTTFSTVHHVDDPIQARHPLPIGRPIPGTGAWVCDPTGHLVPPGAVGELAVSGSGLAIGYLGRPDDTGRAFGPHCRDVDEPVYRTGDLARWNRSGELEYHGRRDRQVKIRGFRIEIDAIEAILRGCPDIRDVLVTTTGTGSDRRLLAALILHPGGDLTRVQTDATHQLPRHAVPSLWVSVPEFPLTRNGKIDLAQLRKQVTTSASPTPTPPATAATATLTPLAPVGPTIPPADPATLTIAATLHHIWAQVLNVPAPAADRSFFDQGGDSLQLLRLAALLRRALPDHHLSVQDLYRHPTIDGLTVLLTDQAVTRP